MKTLPSQFQGTKDQKFQGSDRYYFKILHRNGDVALLEKTNPKHKSKRVFYEVVIIQHLPEKKWPNGIITEAREAMPPAESWGTLGFSPMTNQDAQKKFDELVKSRNNSVNSL